MAVQLTCKDCLSPEFCAVDGCTRRPPQALGPALSPLRPIELPRLVRQPRPPKPPRPAKEHRPSRIMSWFLRPRMPAAPPNEAFAAILEEIRTIMSAPAPAPVDLPLKPPKPGAKLVVAITRNGKPVVMVDGEPIAAGTPEDVADAVRVWLVGG